MKVIQAGLQNSVVTTYDKTKTYLAGRAFQKTLNGQLVVGPPLTNFMDWQTDLGFAPTFVWLTGNGRCFGISAATASVVNVGVYQFDLTGQTAPVAIGSIKVQLPNLAATTHTLKDFKVYDGASPATVTGWQILIATTGSVLINGGDFLVNNISQSQFVLVSVPTVGMAISTGATGVYKLEDPGNIGVNNNLTSIQGGMLDTTNRKWYFHNGLVAATQIGIWDLTVSPAVNNTYTTPTAQTTLYAGTSPAAFFKLPTITASGFVANDPVVLTGTVPTGFTASTSAAMTAYFIRDIQVIGSDTYFNLSATSGGAAITPTSSVASGMSIMRAWGTSSSLWTSTKTGNLTGFAGVFLLTNCEKAFTPNTAQDPNLPSALNNVLCGFILTTTNMFIFKLSDITNGATTLPSLATVNVVGTGTDFTAETPLVGTYSGNLSQAIYASNTSQFYGKYWQNSIIANFFGGQGTQWWETIKPKTLPFQMVAVAGISSGQGWLLVSSITVGQRGIFFMDLKSDVSYAYSFVTSAVLATKNVAFFKFIQTLEQLFDITDSIVFSYKTATTSGDAVFNDPTTGWTTIPISQLLTSFNLQAFSQFRFDFDIASLLENTPAQIQDFFAAVQLTTEISDYWEGSNDNTTQSGGSPQYVAFRQTTVYASLPSKLVVRGVDDSGNIIQMFDTSSSLTPFSQSNNNGTSWAALGSIGSLFNVAGTSEIRVVVSSPAGTRLTWSISES